MEHVRVVRLPDRFYLPRRTYSGQEIFDVVPWDGATDYVTDGKRYGVMMAGGHARWFEESRAAQFAEDFAGVDLEALVDGLQEYCRRYRVLQSVWKEDLELLEQLRSGQVEPAERAEERPEDLARDPGPASLEAERKEADANVRNFEF
ncbi:MAG: hypothetical protein WD737_14065 [Gemmatimonadota bacterium]